MLKLALLLLLAVGIFAGNNQQIIKPHNRAPYMLDKGIILAGEQNSTVSLSLNGIDPEGGGVYFVLTEAVPMDGVHCIIKNANILECTVEENVVSYSDDCLIGKTRVTECKEGEIRTVIYDGGLEINSTLSFPNKMSDKEYTIRFRVNANSGDELPGMIPNKKDGRSYYYTQKGTWTESEYGQALVSSNPAESIANNVDKYDPGYMKYAMDNLNDLSLLSTRSIAENSAARSALGEAGGHLDGDLLNEVKMFSVEYTPFNGQEELPKSCIIDRGGVFMDKYYVCSSDPNYPDNIAAASHYYAVSGMDDVAYANCSLNCFTNQECTDNSSDAYHEYFKDISEITPADAALFQSRFSSDHSVIGVRIKKRSNTGQLISNHEILFDAPVSGDNFRWPYDNGNSEINQIINDKLTFSLGTLGNFKAYNVNNSYFVEPDRRYFIKYKYGLIEYKTHQADDLYSMELIIHTNKFDCSLMGGPTDSFETMTECNNACRVSDECFSFSALNKDGTESIRNYCKDMMVNIGGSTIPLKIAFEQGKCTLTDEMVLDKNGEVAEYYIKNEELINTMRPELDFQEDSAVLLKENSADMATAFVDMIRNGEQQHRFSKAVYNNGNNKEFVDFNGEIRVDTGDVYSHGIVMQGTNDSDRDLYLISIITPHMYEKNKDKKYSDPHVPYGAVIIKTDVVMPLIATDSNSTTDIYYRVLKADKLSSLNMHYNTEYGVLHWDTIRVLKGKGTYNNNTINISPAVSIESDVWTDISKYSAKNFARVLDPLKKEIPAGNALSDDTFGSPIRTTLIGKDVNLYTSYNSNVFVYVDTLQDIHNRSIKDIVNTVINTHANGDHKYHVWSYDESSKVIKKYGDESYYGPQGEALSIYKQSYAPNDTPSFFMDSTKSRKDKLFFGASDDSIRLQMATNRNFNISSSTGTLTDSGGMDNSLSSSTAEDPRIICQAGLTYNSSSKQCESVEFTDDTCTYPFQYNNRTLKCEIEAQCPVGTTYNNNTGECLGIPTLEKDKKIMGPGTSNPDGILATCPIDSNSQLIAKEKKCIENVWYLPTLNNSYCDSGWIIDNATLLCKKPATGMKCSIGSTYSITRDICMKPAATIEGYGDICPIGSTFCLSLNRCISTPQCDGGGYYDVATGTCKKMMATTAMSRNGYYYAYIKEPNSNYAYFLTPLGNGDAYQCEQNQHKCDITSSLFNSKKSCENNCFSFGTVSNIDSEPSYSSGNCLEVGAQGKALSGVQYSSKDNCEKRCYIPDNNTIMPALDVLIQFTGGSATDAYNITVKRKLSNGSYLDYTSKTSYSPDSYHFGLNNDGILFKKLKKNEEIEIRYRSQPDARSGKHYGGLGRWKAEEVESMHLGVSQKITIGGKTCYNLNAYYPLNKLKINIDTDFNGEYDDSAEISDGFICESNVPFEVVQTIAFNGKKITYDYIDMMSSSHDSTLILGIKDSGECEINTNVDDTAMIPYFSDIIPPEALDGNVFGVFKNIKGNKNATIEDVVDIILPASPKKFKLGVVKVDISEYLGQKEKFDPKVIHNEVQKNNIPIPFWSGVFAADYFYAVMNDTGFGDKILPNGEFYMGYGYSQNDDCRSFTIVPPFLSQDTRREYDKPNMHGVCPTGFTYESGLCWRDKTVSVTVDEMKICRPWWTLNRMYSCKGTDDEYIHTSIADELSFGYPRWVNVCSESVESYKKLTLDSDGNIVEKGVTP